MIRQLTLLIINHHHTEDQFQVISKTKVHKLLVIKEIGSTDIIIENIVGSIEMEVDQKAEEIEILKKNIHIIIEMEADQVTEKNATTIIVTVHQTTMQPPQAKNVRDMKAQATNMVIMVLNH